MGKSEVSFSTVVCLSPLSALTRAHSYLAHLGLLIFIPSQWFLGFSGPPCVSLGVQRTFSLRRQLLLPVSFPQQRHLPLSLQRDQQPSHARIQQCLLNRSPGSTSQSTHGSLRILQGSFAFDLPTSHRQSKLEGLVPISSSASSSSTTSSPTCTHFHLLYLVQPSAATTTSDSISSSSTTSSESPSPYDSPPRRSRSLLLLRPLKSLPSFPSLPLPSSPPSTPAAATAATTYEPAAARSVLSTPSAFRSRSTGQIVRRDPPGEVRELGAGQS